MSVPVGLAGDQSPPNNGLLMPKLKYRFRVLFENFGVNPTTTELTKQVIDFARPEVQFEQIDLPIYNSTIKLAGKHSWQDVTVNIRDDAGANVQKLVGEQLQKQLDFLEMASASAGIDYKFITKFEVLDGGNGAVEPVVLESWELYGCYLKSVNYNDANYADSAAMTISMTIAFDNANQIVGGGVGSTGTLLGQTVAGSATGIASGV